MAELTTPEPAHAHDDIREVVRERYAAAARAAADADDASCGCGPGRVRLGALRRGGRAGATQAAVSASLGCGVPTAVADLHEGETVLDLGSGAGADVLISARRVGASGRAIGLDMTDEMLALARANAAQAGVDNVEFVKGYIEDIPLPDASVDVVISNCVINLAGDKPKVLAEAARVLRPGGRFAVSDVIADPGMDEATRADMAAYTGCIAGALTEREFRAALSAAGLTDVEIRETHRVHDRGRVGHRARPQARPAERSAPWPPRSSSAARTPGARRCPRRSSSRPAGGRHRALSAGTTPADRVHPEVVAVMRELGIDLSDRVPRAADARDGRAGRRRGDHGLRRRVPLHPRQALRRLGARRPRRAAGRGGPRHPRRDRRGACASWWPSSTALPQPHCGALVDSAHGGARPGDPSRSRPRQPTYRSTSGSGPRWRPSAPGWRGGGPR